MEKYLLSIDSIIRNPWFLVGSVLLVVFLIAAFRRDYLKRIRAQKTLLAETWQTPVSLVGETGAYFIVFGCKEDKLLVRKAIPDVVNTATYDERQKEYVDKSSIWNAFSSSKSWVSIQKVTAIGDRFWIINPFPLSQVIEMISVIKIQIDGKVVLCDPKKDVIADNNVAIAFT